MCPKQSLAATLAVRLKVFGQGQMLAVVEEDLVDIDIAFVLAMSAELLPGSEQPLGQTCSPTWPSRWQAEYRAQQGTENANSPRRHQPHESHVGQVGRTAAYMLTDGSATRLQLVHEPPLLQKCCSS